MIHRSLVLSLVASLAIAAAAAAQVGPISPQTIAAPGPLSAEQLEEVASAVNGWADKVLGEDADDVIDARNEVERLATKTPSATVAFRRELGLAFDKRFEGAAVGGTADRSVTIFVMARLIGTFETVEFIADHLNPDKCDSPAVRIAASAQLPKAVEAPLLSPPQLDGLAKRVATIASKEREWIAVAHEFEALGAMIRRQGLSAAQAEAIGSSLSATINDLTERVNHGSAPEMVHALQRALLVVRNQLSGVPASARAKLLADIAPSLKQLADSEGKPPASMGTDRRLSETYKAVSRTAGLLQKVRATDGA